MDLPTGTDRLKIAAFLDTVRFPWAEELIDFTVRLINDGWQGDILGGVPLEYSISNSDCDRGVAVRAFLKTISQHGLPNAILGTRCTAPTMAIATLAAAENVALLSPAATGPMLSNKGDYPTSNRLVAGDTASGQVGALVSLLQEFGWDRISIINTNTQYAQEFKVELTRAWRGMQDGFTGEIGYEGTVQVDQDTDEVDPDSVKAILSNVPVKNPSLNSRVVVLLAHHQHAFPILKIAKQEGFQPDTVFVGCDAWTGRAPLDPELSWMGEHPGYVGLVPYRNFSGAVYKDFLGRLQDEQKREGRPVMTNLPDSAADRTVDSVLALAKALARVSPEHRFNGTAVVDALRSHSFEGVSGSVEFDGNGDRANPRYTVMSFPHKGGGFIPIGTAAPGFVDIDLGKVCYAEVGCGVVPPSATDPVVPWRLIGLAILGALLAILFPLACYLYKKHLPIKRRLKLLEEEIEAMDSNEGARRRRKGSLYKEIARLLEQPRPATWTDAEGLVAISHTDAEYWEVFKKMRETTSEDVWISKLFRLQNDGLWSYWVFRKNQLASKYGFDFNDKAALNEQVVWHGTSSLNPDVITSDSHDGFMMNYAAAGHFGRGLYFAERFEYSDCYSYRVNNQSAMSAEGITIQDGDDREIFLVNLLVGQAIEMNREENEEECRALVAPPCNPNTDGLRYDTVSGVAPCGTKIHTVYENGRAYPSYLIRYYKGPRDPSRTPFESQEEAQKETLDVTSRTESSEGDSDENNQPGSDGWSLRGLWNSLRSSQNSTAGPDAALDGAPRDENIEGTGGDGQTGTLQATTAGTEEGQVKALWFYHDDVGQSVPYSGGLQAEIEAAYQRDPQGSLTIAYGTWAYLVDFGTRTQTNRDHPGHRQRRISRMDLP
ncbi:polymerase 12 [Seminavis robusta]|uniref:Polymerase 12 n=1 Tax=Seminavis robusta TaxID=568900 RepID=A0A9N8HKG3_9STRA|nr:polymerase 12 [Seminavis robusta]|eukprot:Sro941_g222650.1 polymerase 12 (886) ;mRNA; r:24358-27253